MKEFKFHAVTTFVNNCSKSHLITFEYDDLLNSRSDCLLSVIQEHEHLHDCYIIDHASKCNVTFDLTVEIKGGLYEKTGKGFNSDRHFFTYKELINFINEGEFLSIIRTPFMRFHYSKSGNAIDYLSLNNIVKKSDNIFDGGLFFDSSLHFEKINHLFFRNSFNEVIFEGLK